MNRIFLLGLLALATTLAGSLVPEREAWASFGDCMDPAYIDGFDSRPSAGGITCIERLRVPVATAEGERHIRIIQDVSADWAFLPGAEAQAERGVRAAAAALGEIGSFSMDDVTVLLLDDLPPTTPEDGSHGVIAGETGARVGQECYIVLYLFDSVTGDPTRLAFNIAHEIFHCVQYASLSAAQMSSGGRGTGVGGDWWLEGSAEWFASLALTGSPTLPGRLAAFEDAVEAGTPLYGMDYDAVVFFMWLGGRRNPTGILPFLRQMADSAGAEAQQAAMRGALSAEDWLRFAEAYLDLQIKHPQDEALTWSVGPGEEWAFDGNRVQTIPLEPFVLTRGWLAFECGSWRIEARPADASAAARPEPGDWAPLPRELDTETESDRLRFAALSSAPRAVNLEVDVERLRSCEPCAGSEELDSCLVGVWQMTGGGPVEWMRRLMPPNVSLPVHEQSDSAFVLNDDGSYWTAPLTQRLVIIARERRGIIRADGTATAQAAGRWSIKDGQLHICQESGSMGGAMVVTSPDGSATMPITAPPGPSTIRMSYSCSETAFQTNMEMPQGGPMTTSYGRISPETP